MARRQVAAVAYIPGTPGAAAPGDAGSPAAIAMENVSLNYLTKAGLVHALDDVSLDVRPRSFVSVIGPSGCGKTTLLKIVSRILPPSKGRVLLGGVDLQKADLSGTLSHVFQKPLLLPWRTALENVLLPLEVMNGRLSSDDVNKARGTLELTGLGGFADKMPHELSGGMQQRVSLARALVIEPAVLLMDEPFSALDEITREAMQEELLRVWQTTRNAILFITHNIPEAILLSDQIVVMSGQPGSIIRTIDVHLARPRDAAVRSSVEFRKLIDELRELLRPVKAKPPT